MRLTARYSYAHNTTPPNLFGDGNPAYTYNDGPMKTKTTSLVTDFTRTENATHYRNPMEPLDLTTLGLPSYMKDNAPYLVLPTFAPDGYEDIGTQGWLIMDRQERVHQFSGSLTKILGGHNLKIGGEMRQYFLDYLQPGYPSGQFNFSSQATWELLNVGDSDQGNGLASMLLGWGNSGQFHTGSWTPTGDPGLTATTTIGAYGSASHTPSITRRRFAPGGRSSTNSPGQRCTAGRST